MAGANGRGGAGLGRHLAEAGQAMLADARRALEDPALTGVGRVHELRKTFKRWRAWLRLVAGPVGEPAGALRGEARALMRGLSGARDAQGALDAIDDLARATTALSPRTLAAIRARMTVLRNAAERESLTPALRRQIAAYLDRAGLVTGGRALDGIAFGAVADALTVTYRRARALAPDDWRNADAAQLHELRRRVVEHRHHLELIEPLRPRVIKDRAAEAQRLRGRLGACQDLAVLAAFAAPHRPLAAWRSRLVPLIAARRAAHLKSASRIAGRLFAEKPKAFRKRIGALRPARKKRKARRIR